MATEEGTRGPVIAAIAAVVVALIGTAGALGAAKIGKDDRPPTTQPSASPSEAITTRTSPALGVQTQIVNTWDEGKSAFIGVQEYPRPDTNTGAIFGPGEGETVTVVCQVRDGREVKDTPFRSRQTSSRVWDQLADGYYISDIYTTLPKVKGPTPPPGVPLC